MNTLTSRSEIAETKCHRFSWTSLRPVIAPVIAIVSVLTITAFSDPTPVPTQTSVSVNRNITSAPGAPGPTSVADLAAMTSPAVVNISTTTRSSSGGSSNGTQTAPNPFRDLFPDFFGRRPEGRTPDGRANERPQRSLGSGFVIASDGLIITNNHVVRNADEITVSFADGTKLVAELIGSDPKTDIALLKVESDKPLPSLKMGDSDVLRVGDWVMAIGNPFGLGGTVTLGIVSAQNRNINAGPYDDFIQTDASINRGNSGGPLINMNGEVVGINTAIISPSGGSIGIGFAVPVTTAQVVIDQLKKFGETRRGWLGVRIQSVSDDIAESMGLDEPLGALVTHVDEGGPAEDAGFQVGDLIVKFDGAEVEQMRDLPRLVAQTDINKRVAVVVLRSDNRGRTREQVLTVVIGRLKENLSESASNSEKKSLDPEVVELLGMTIADATDLIRRRFGLDASVEGPIVLGVEQGSAAAEKFISPGSQIISVARQAVSSVVEVRRKVERESRNGGGAVLVLLQTPDGSKHFVGLPTSKEK